MESELNSSDDSLESTAKIPLIVRGDEIDDRRPQQRSIPSIVRRGEVTPAKPTVDRAERATIVAPVPTKAAAATFTWPLSPTKPREPGQWKPPAAPLPKSKMPAAQHAKAPQSVVAAPIVEIANAPAALTAPSTLATAGRTTRPNTPATEPWDVEPASARVVETTPNADEPAVYTEPATIATEPRAIANKLPPRESASARREARISNEQPTAVPPPPAFGAGMLKARARRAKETTARGDLSSMSMLSSANAAPQFGAGMLQARRSRGKLVVAIVLAAVTIAALSLAMRGGPKPGGTPAVTQQKT